MRLHNKVSKGNEGPFPCINSTIKGEREAFLGKGILTGSLRV